MEGKEEETEERGGEKTERMKKSIMEEGDRWKQDKERWRRKNMQKVSKSYEF